MAERVEVQGHQRLAAVPQLPRQFGVVRLLVGLRQRALGVVRARDPVSPGLVMASHTRVSAPCSGDSRKRLRKVLYACRIGLVDSAAKLVATTPGWKAAVVIPSAP